ncbi:hypothetical protein RHMOL_Rhmol01G0142100 [Rhododendron molle]|uniref:Uncharacterized protein n=1 Tax=Rhododendron molle TaxID=49168 RepID=A0ACC0Q1M9_RHOML|nr:hypothetical protein RHMOL_Rhmol01G0142100 [Rhododendron molle]
MEGEDKGSVCVIGGTGYVASWLIMRLLQSGYTVRTTVRSYPGAPEKLEIFAADLNDPESFNGVIRGCTGVFLVAHPVSFEEKVPEEVTNQRAVKGTLGILQACLDSRTVKRVIYTSSAFTVMYNDKSSGIIDERNWTDVDYVRILKPFGESYIISKTLAERAALEFAEAHGLNLVSLIPPMIIGPFICSRCPGSIYTVLALIIGEEDQYKNLPKTSMIHVDDVASAHIFLLEHANLTGRFLKGIEESKYPGLSSKKLLDTGFKFKYGFEEMFDAAIQCCKEKGFI